MQSRIHCKLPYHTGEHQQQPLAHHTHSSCRSPNRQAHAASGPIQNLAVVCVSSSPHSGTCVETCLLRSFVSCLFGVDHGHDHDPSNLSQRSRVFMMTPHGKPTLTRGLTPIIKVESSEFSYAYPYELEDSCIILFSECIYEEQFNEWNLKSRISHLAVHASAQPHPS